MGKFKDLYIDQMNEQSQREFEQEEAEYLEQVAYSKGLIPPLEKERRQHEEQVGGFLDLLKKQFDNNNDQQH